MSKRQKHQNPYKRGNYATLFAYMKRKQVVTRKELEIEAKKLISNYGKNKGQLLDNKKVSAMVSVLLSPRETSARGDCRGNLSAKGHVYYMQLLKKKKGEEQRFRLRYRAEVLPKRKRNEVIAHVSQETTSETEVIETTHTEVDENATENIE